MPPKKKSTSSTNQATRASKRTNGVTADPTPSKKAKLDVPKIDGYEIQFEWEGDGHKWIQYSKKYNRLLVDAFNAKKKQVELSVPSGAKMLIQFEKMVQKNKKTGWERRVRAAVKSNVDKDFEIAEWKDEGNKWSAYSVPTSLEIAKAVEGGSTTLTTKTTPNPYDIDLKKNTQTNSKTGFSRQIRRVATDSEKPPDYDDDDDGKDEITVKKEEEEEEMKEEEEQQTKSGKGKAKSGAKSAGKSGGSGKSGVRTVVLKKGSAPVDSLCPLANKCVVYEAGKVIWDCMLNQTNIGNNNNKFYLIQLLHEEGRDLYHVWQRWGRVGYDGQNNLVQCGKDLNKAMNEFCKKFKAKTMNDWSNKDSFEKVPGKYDLLKMDYSVGDDAPTTTDDVDGEDVKVPDSKLDKKVQDLVKLICDVKSMEAAVVEMKYDAKKAPLGKLTKDQIKAGYSALKKIEGLLEKNDFGRNLADACSEFYTRIPHEFGMQTPPLIRTPQMVKKKIELLEALEDIEIAIKMLKAGDKSENPVDRNYHQLKCEIEPLDSSSGEYKLIDKYLQQTHAATHNQYKMELLDVFKCEKDGEASKFKDLGNRMLLWHGSRLTNWAGILGQGLRIAPPEAPVTGYMFGKGVYFADMSSKSANYCFATKAKNIGLLLLCDVALGTIDEKLNADYQAAKLPKGKHSVMGKGKIAPDPSANVTLPDGVTVPVGKGKNTGVTNPSGYTLNYNEFIVYDVSQIRMKYLVQVKFNFKY